MLWIVPAFVFLIYLVVTETCSILDRSRFYPHTTTSLFPYTTAIRTPFAINFRSDAYEVVPEAANTGGNTGFQLVYFQDATGCNAAGVVP